MYTNLKSLMYLILLVMLPKTAFSGWIDRKAEGWAWYEEENKIAEDNINQEPANTPFPSELSPSQKMAEIRKNLENSLSLAILEPTTENVQNYMREQKKWVDQAGKFSKTWSYVVLNDSGLDATIDFPVSQYGIQVQKQVIREETEQLIKNLTNEYGLFFFYEGKEKTSQALSLVVSVFEKKYGWNVMGISLDGVLIPGIENNKHDNGIAKTFGVSVTPSLYLVHPEREKAIPIAYGLVSLDRIESNVKIQFTNSKAIK